MPQYSEFSIGHMLREGYAKKSMIDNYLPEEPNTDRAFFWAILMKNDGETMEKYI